jgi:hypothetical protein
MFSGGYNTNWFQRNLGLYIGFFALIMTVLNINKPSSMRILAVITVLIFLTAFIRNKVTMILQCLIMIIASSLALIGNMKAYQNIFINGFPSDAIIMFGFTAFTLFIYGFYDGTKFAVSAKVAVSMLFLFACMMFPFTMFSSDILVTFLCFVLFTVSMCVIGWLGFKVLTDKYEKRIVQEKEQKEQALKEAKSAVNMAENIMKEFIKISDENDTYKAAFSEMEENSCQMVI